MRGILILIFAVLVLFKIHDNIQNKKLIGVLVIAAWNNGYWSGAEAEHKALKNEEDLRDLFIKDSLSMQHSIDSIIQDSYLP